MMKLVNAFILSVFFLCFMGAGLSLTISDDSSGGGCTSVGTWNSTTKTCTLTIDLNEAIAIYGPGVTLNGNGHTVSGGDGFAGIIIYGSSITVKNLKMTGFSYTIRVDGAGNNRIINNTILNSAFGLYVRSTDNLIANNTIDTASMRGIALVYGNNVVTNNYIMNSIRGVDIRTDVGSSNNKIYNNNFIDNTFDITYDPFIGSDTFNLTKPIGGNYYNDYDTPEEGCNDLDLDGFCDKLYTPSIGIQDNLPWTQMNGWVDSVPPVTTVSLSGTSGNNDWYVSDVQVTLTATDSSGISKTEYSFNNVDWTTYTDPFTINTEGITTVYYRSVDNNDNVEPTKTKEVKIDKTKPVVTINMPTAIWNHHLFGLNDNVLASWSATDDVSGVDVATGSSPDGQPIDTSVAGTNTFSATATDKAGNTQEVTVTYYVFLVVNGESNTGGDCSLMGVWDDTTKTCTMTSDLNDKTVLVYGAGTTLEGDGHTMTGGNWQVGVIIHSGITVKNLKLVGFGSSLTTINFGINPFGYFYTTPLIGNNKIINNIISSSRGSTVIDGIQLQTASNLVEGNTIENVDNAIDLIQYWGYLAKNQTIRYNNIINCMIGIMASQDTDNVSIYNNNFIGNDYNAGGRWMSANFKFLDNTFNLTKPIGGNYYSDYTDCVDSDSDGFCDTPYTSNAWFPTDYLPWAKMDGWADQTAPETTVNISGNSSPDGWYVSGVGVTLTTADNEGGSGVARVEYSFDNATWNTYTGPFTININGIIIIYCRSIDNNGNVESVKTHEIKVDNIAPTITGNATASPNLYGWYNYNLTVLYTCRDNISGVLEPLLDKIASMEGFNLSVKGTCTDKAGNTVELTVSGINIDKTAPTITIDTPVPYGLYTNGTALNFSGSDSLSGVANISGILTNTLGTVQNVESGYVPAPGVYTLVVEACDKASNCQMSNPVDFVVYDPNGGFATGRGRLIPDAESTLPNVTASFGFVAKYLKGESTGNLDFQYKDVEIDLESTTIDWLVISGVSAQFQGTGTINGVGLYTFRVLAKDNAKLGMNADQFDIRIWEGTNTNVEPMHKAKNTIALGNIIVQKK